MIQITDVTKTFLNTLPVNKAVSLAEQICTKTKNFSMIFLEFLKIYFWMRICIKFTPKLTGFNKEKSTLFLKMDNFDDKSSPWIAPLPHHEKQPFFFWIFQLCFVFAGMHSSLVKPPNKCCIVHNPEILLSKLCINVYKSATFPTCNILLCFFFYTIYCTEDRQ